MTLGPVRFISYRREQVKVRTKERTTVFSILYLKGRVTEIDKKILHPIPLTDCLNG